MTKTLQGLYVSFSGESGGASINNVYALDLDLVIKSKEVLDAKSAPAGKLLGLRGLAFGPDGDLYVAQGKDTGERALPPPPLRFSGSVVPRPGALCSTRIPSCRLTLRRDLRIPTSRCSAAQAGDWRDTRTSTTQNGCAMIRRCVGSSAATRPRGARRRQARWVASRRAGLRLIRTCQRSPIFPANGSTAFTLTVRREA